MDRRILVIDDDVAIQKVLVHHLTDGHTQVQSASDGESGLALARQCRPDLILLDVDMPGISGNEVCRRLKFDPMTQGIPIAFLTATASVNDRIVGLDQGAVDYIAKPFDPFEVAARTRAAFRVQSMVELATSRTMLDTLTGLGNRAAFDQHLRAELARSHRSAEPLACIMIEPDQLAEIAGLQGQVVHDGVLCDVADILKEICREEDRIFRYSETRFAVVAPRVSAVDLIPMGERVRLAVQSRPAPGHRSTLPITISVGMAISRFSRGRTVAVEAVEALVQAKNAGGDSVVAGGELIELQLAG